MGRHRGPGEADGDRLSGVAFAPAVKAAFFHEHGGLDQLEVGELPTPEPGPGEVLLRVQACALNHLDLFVREGWPGLRLPMPHIGGTDVAGTVAKVGDGVEEGLVGRDMLVNAGLNFVDDPDRPGDMLLPDAPSILGETCAGALAEFVLVPASQLVPKPAQMSWEEAAAFPLTALTATRMLKKAGLWPQADGTRPGEGARVLVPGGAGGVSVMAIQLAKACGAWVCATTSAEKMDRVRDLGADLVLDRRAPDWAKEAFLATDKEGFDVVLESVGQATWRDSVRALRNGGRLVTCGATTGPVGETDIRLVFWKQLHIIGSTMGTATDLADALALWQAGQVRPFVDSVWSLQDAKAAQGHLAAGGHFGKVVIKP